MLAHPHPWGPIVVRPGLLACLAVETPLVDPSGVLVSPDDGGTGTGVLVLGGSSGRVEAERARLLARHGAVALSIRWFADPGQPPGICEVPLETFLTALDHLARLTDRLAVLGLSKGAEAALLVAAHDPRVGVVAAFAPTHVAWANLGPGLDGRAFPYRSSWTLGGDPVPFVPYDDTWHPTDDPPSYRELYRASLTCYPERAVEATIPVERIRGDVMLVAGHDDQVWDSAASAEHIADRRNQHGLPTTVISHPDAGHRTVLPGEAAATGGAVMRRGGTPATDAALGQSAWPALARALNLQP